MTQESVVTPEFRLSFPVLFQAQPDMNGRINFRMDMVFPKDVAKTHPKEIMAMKKLYDSGVKPEWIAGNLPYRTFQKAFINGDTKNREEMKGKLILRANSGPEYPPRLLRRDGTLATPADLYAGCFCRAVLTRYFYEATNEKGVVINRGVSFNIHTVQKIKDGPKLSKALTDEQADRALAAVPLDDAEMAELDDMLG